MRSGGNYHIELRSIAIGMVVACLVTLLGACQWFDRTAQVELINSAPAALIEFKLGSAESDSVDYGDNLLQENVPSNESAVIEDVSLGSYSARLSFDDGVYIILDNLPLGEPGEYRVIVTRSADGVYSASFHSD